MADRGIDPELEHERLGVLGEPRVELVGIGILAAVAAQEVFLVNQVEDRLRVVAEGRICAR